MLYAIFQWHFHLPFFSFSVLFFFFKQKTAYEIGTGDWSSDVCSSDLCPFLVAAAPRFFLPISCCGSAHAFYTHQFLLRQHPRFLYCPFLVVAAPHFLHCPVLFAAAPPLFIFTNSRCGSAHAFYTYQFLLRQRPAFYTAHFSLQQRPSFLYLPILAAAAPPLLIQIGRASCRERV